MRTVYLSDAHLSVAPGGRDTMDAFVAFLRRLDPADVARVVVLGDLFDFWFEYKHVVFSGYFDVLRAFADLRDAGVELHFVCGNHDFWAGRFLETQIGFTVHLEPVTLEIDGRRVHLAHGDGINPDDWRYRAYKRVARWGGAVRLFRLLHPDWAMAIAQRVSRGSRQLFSPSDPGKSAEIGPLRAYAERRLAAGDADVVVCAHCHYPERMEFATPGGTGLYLNTGDWMWHRSYVVSEGVDFRLASARSAALAEPVSSQETQAAEQQE